MKETVTVSFGTLGGEETCLRNRQIVVGEREAGKKTNKKSLLGNQCLFADSTNYSIGVLSCNCHGS